MASATVDSRVPDLRCITSYPIFLPGFELCQPGYRDGVYYDEPDALHGLGIELDAETIRLTLEDAVVDFPFRDQASRENYFGLMITPFIRNAIDGNAPGTLIHAPLERTGKTKLAEIIGAITIGRRTPAMQISDSNEEMDKRLLAMLLRGETLLHLDNLRERLDLPCLASLLTATTYQGRLLGSTKILDIPNNLTIVATGNNVKATGEIAKRMVPVCLQPASDAPELRTDFQHADLWGHVRQNRRRLMECLLGAVRLWVNAGKPRGEKPMGGFDEWAAVVGGIMSVVGFEQWLDNASEWRDAADWRRSDLRALVAEWHKEHAGLPLKVNEILAIAERLELFPDVLTGKEGKSLVTSFGMKVLSRNIDTPVEGFIIRKNSMSRPAIYSLQAIESGVEA